MKQNKLTANELSRISIIIQENILKKREKTPSTAKETAFLNTTNKERLAIAKINTEITVLEKKLNKLRNKRDDVHLNLNSKVSEFNKKQKDSKTYLKLLNMTGVIEKKSNYLSQEITNEINDTLFLKNISSSDMEEIIKQLTDKY